MYDLRFELVAIKCIEYAIRMYNIFAFINVQARLNVWIALCTCVENMHIKYNILYIHVFIIHDNM